MNTHAIDRAFEQVIKRRGIHKVVGRSVNSVLQLRWRLRHGKGVGYSTKIFYLQKAKYPMGEVQYTNEDLVKLLKFYDSMSKSGKAMGAGYIIEKWKRS